MPTGVALYVNKFLHWKTKLEKNTQLNKNALSTSHTCRCICNRVPIDTDSKFKGIQLHVTAGIFLENFTRGDKILLVGWRRGGGTCT